MKNLFFLLVIAFIPLSCLPQHESATAISLSISPAVDKESSINKRIIHTLESFLATKNESAAFNKYWLAADFKKFVTPYIGIFDIEHSKSGRDFYKPSLMEIIPTDSPAKKIVKIAYIGHNFENKENTIRAIYNIVANVEGEKVIFSSYIDHATRNWEHKETGSINYIISPSRTYNKEQAQQQQKDIDVICKFFECLPVGITYYSCANPVELFQIKGFDYNPMMYVSDTGGLAEKGNIIFSGNNSEFYTHEIVHVYMHNLHPDAPEILNEGIATYLGGSGTYAYPWHKTKLKQYSQKQAVDFTAFVENPYDRTYIDNETPLAYMTGALICENVIKNYGKEKLISLLANTGDSNIWDLLGKVGLTKKNLNTELQKSL